MLVNNCNLVYSVGVGLSLSYSPSIVAVGQYFEKRRATANGVSFAGSGLGSLILPPLIRFVTLMQFHFLYGLWVKPLYFSLLIYLSYDLL